MASSREYLDYILEQLSELDDVDSKDYMARLFEVLYDELPAPKKKNETER